jgi:uncharacterized membrane protein (UPF0127 family)
VTSKGVAHFKVEVADSFATRERGLMFRKHLGAQEGMLFEFEKPQPQWFWMKNTLIPLDMLFLDPKGEIVSIARDATPMSETPIGSGADAVAVLEIPGGRAAQIGAEPGDKVSSRFFHP